MKKYYSRASMPLILLFLIMSFSMKAQVVVNLASSTNVSCAGGTNGMMSVTATGGTAPYTYSWSPAPGSGQGTANATLMIAGTYTCTVHDAVAATNSYIGTITQPTAMAPTGTPVNESCSGGTNGSASVTVTGGSTPYTYSWSPVAGAANSLLGQPAGTYTCHITDNHGCVATQNVTITQPTPLNATATPSNALCFGGTGSINVVPSGGSPAYTYSWSPSGGTGAIANVPAGSYTCFITDNHGCAYNITQSVSQPPAITTPFTQTNVSCYGGSDGSATVTAANGFVPYTYSWHPSGGTASTATGLTASSFTCFVTDGHGCNVMQSINITQPSNALSTAISSQSNVLCNGASNGSATVTPNGGTPPYSYSWSPISNSTSTASGLSAGSFNCTVTDSKGCTISQGVTITQPAPLLATDTHKNISCYGGSDGTVTVIPSGGTPGYYYSWVPTGGASNTVSAMSAGTYTCSITDMNSCIDTYVITLTQPPALNISATSTNVTCTGSANGTATATASGGVAAYTYSWSPPSSGSASVSGLTPGSYTCYVT
ncbi:MAG TPA: SprB repeat-containing protein, partial [Bacteroidia bacterium]|nr:SprB repeat-containing protein [Bacteroidia bacterium]